MSQIERSKSCPDNDAYRILVLASKNDHMPAIVAACKEIGQEVVPCFTIKEAFAFLDTKDHVDLILLEAFLENESAFDFLKAAKETDELKHVPIMIMAAEPGQIGMFCTPSVSQTAELLGAYKFISMPKFDASHLVREIKAILPAEHAPRKVQDSSDEQ